MAKFSYADLEAAQERRANAQNNTPRQSVSYFGLKNDGDEAIVRFAYTDVSQFDFMSVHQVKIGNSYRKINCLRSYREPVQKCPFCASGDESLSKVFTRFYVKLLEYVRDDQSNIVPMPRIWEKSANFAKTLASYFNEYGDLSECVFKIKRHGQPGSVDTTYDIILANPMVYKPEIYAKDFSAFDTYSLNRYVVLDKTAEEMNAFLANGEFPAAEIPTTKTAEVNEAAKNLIPNEAENRRVEQALGMNNQATPAVAQPEAKPADEPVRPRRYTF